MQSVQPGQPPTAASQSGALQLMHLFENSASGLLTCDHDGRVLLCSPVAASLLAATPEAVCAKGIKHWLAPLVDCSQSAGPLLACGQWETLAQRADGSDFPVELTVSETVLDGTPQFILILRDITDRRLTQERLSSLADFDSLTGLPNRVLFRDRLEQAMASALQPRSDGADVPGPGPLQGHQRQPGARGGRRASFARPTWQVSLRTRCRKPASIRAAWRWS